MGIPILGEIEKLITEHGSAAILKERIALANDKFLALEKELFDTKQLVSESKTRESELKSENQRLKFDNEQLRQEIQRRNDVIQKEKSHNDLLKDYKMVWGCIKFARDDKLYCPSCFHKTGKKIETSRVDTRKRYCAVCKTTLPSG